jgi:hypothetical protein
MVEEPRTKDVFRELDGFLVMVSMFSTLALPEVQGQTIIDPEQRMEMTRLAFAIISEAMRDHFVNSSYFNVSIATLHACEESNLLVPETSWLYTAATGSHTVNNRSTNVRSDHGIFACSSAAELLTVQSIYKPSSISSNASQD